MTKFMSSGALCFVHIRAIDNNHTILYVVNRSNIYKSRLIIHMFCVYCVLHLSN